MESESESEHNSIADDENRLSDDEDFPISEDDDEEEEEEAGPKGGWAGSIAKILNSEKSVVLSKAKKVEDVAKKKEKKSYTFEIDGKEEQEEDSDEEDAPEKRIQERKKRKEKRENKIRVFSLRMKPSIVDLDRERTFRKIATRGVVQLFNAVRSQNATLDKKLETVKIDSKRDEILKSKDNKKSFLDTLMSGPRARSELVDKAVKKEKKEEDSSDDMSGDDDEDGGVKKSTWSALRDDFMTGKKVGWDKSDDEEEVMESDSD